MGAAEATLAIEVTCEFQGETWHRQSVGEGLFLEMAPGKDGLPWFLCSRCWFDGMRCGWLASENTEATAVVEPEAPLAPAPEAPRKRKGSGKGKAKAKAMVAR